MNYPDYKFKGEMVDGRHVLTAKRYYYSGFYLAHDTYNALSMVSDGKVYYVLSSDSIQKGGQFYCYDPVSDTIKLLGDLTVPSRKSGMFDQFSYGYLGFQLAPDNETIYYLTGGPVHKNG